MRKIVLFGIISLIFLLNVFAVTSISQYTRDGNVRCEPIDYEDTELWSYYESQGLFPIIDARTGKPIVYPVGCE